MRALVAALLFAAPAVAEEVYLPGPEGRLAAELVAVPDAEHVIVLIPGSGPTDRDGNGPYLATDAYQLLAEALAAEGVASLRIDKRGMFASRAAIADANAVTLGDYAADAQAWVARAAGVAPCVWLAGHSEGGLVALAAAADPPAGLCGLILLATPGRPLGDVLLEQFARNPANAGSLPDAERVVEALENGEAVDPATIPTPLRPLFPTSLQPYWMSFLAKDPVELAAEWPGPVLVVHGGRDLQVTPADADALMAVLADATRADLPHMTHVLKQDVPDQPLATYSDRDLPLDEGLVPAILGFLAGHRP